MRVTSAIVALLLALTAFAADKPDDLTPERRQELQRKARDLIAEGTRQYDARNHVKARDAFRELVEVCRTLYPKKDFPQGHVDLAESINRLGFIYWAAEEYDQAEPLFREGLDMRRALFAKEKYPRGHSDLATSINNLADVYEKTGEHGKAGPLRREALAMYRALYPKEEYPQGHTDLASSITHVGRLHRDAGEYGQAEPLYKEALAMYRALFPRDKYARGHPFLASSINNLALVHHFAGEYGQAEPLFREALAMYRALYPREKYPRGHPNVANSISNLALLHHDAGDYGQAEPLFREAVAMHRALFPREKYPRGHPDLATSINNMAMLHRDAGEYGKAEPLLKEALDMSRALCPREKYPRGHPDVACSLNNLALLHHSAGEYGKAEALYKEALDMYRLLYPREQYPRGHPDFAGGISNLALLYKDEREFGQAEPLYREALDMKRALFPREQYPHGHPDLASGIQNVASLHQSAGEYDKAEPLCKEALAMYRALYPREKYPRGHPHLAASINNLAVHYEVAGAYGRAEPLYREALDMNRALFPRERYPQGHPFLANGIQNLAALHRAAGEYGQAETLLKESLAMYRGLLLRHAELAAEAECLNYLATQPAARDALLSVTRLPAPSVAAYDALWDGRAAITRLLAARHRDLMASRDSDTRDLADQLRRARLTLARRLLHPLPDPEKHRAEVQQLTDTKEDLEKRIAAKLKLAAPQSATPPSLQRLIERLPDGAAFVDLYRYTRLEQDPDIKGLKGRKGTNCYVAFVVRRGQPVARVELREAAPIERAWTEWRQTLTAGRADEKAERAAAAALAKLVWEPLRKELPADLRTVYLTPDGELHQLPWGALPGRKPDTVLLDEHTVCLVPHGPFLLERLESDQRAAASGTLLAVGGVDYDGPAEAVAAQGAELALREAAVGPRGVRWSALSGTDRERQQVAALARQAAKLDVVERSGKVASTEQLQRDLPAARYAHVATHGFFADPQFRSALQFDPRQFERVTQDRRGGARSPLALSGLVLAGANRTGKDMAEDRGIITAEGLIALRLEGLELAVLSACETGLGAWGGGEGVYGLQRAFHVAGCKGVVASLWKVDDGATQALMALFYRNLWDKKLDAAEALRQAQLTLYRHPEAIAVAAKRGVDFTETDLPKVEEKPAEKPARAPAAHWAAFTFSGVRPMEKPEPK
jgi:CHAT domain-containing protein